MHPHSLNFLYLLFFAFPKIIYWQSALCDTKILYFNNCVSSVRPILKKQTLKITLYFTYYDLYHLVTIKEKFLLLEEKQSENDGLWAKSGPPTIFLNKVLLTRNHTLLFTYHLRLLSCSNGRGNSDRDHVPIKPKIFAMWSSTEKVFLFLIKRFIFFFPWILI